MASIEAQLGESSGYHEVFDHVEWLANIESVESSKLVAVLFYEIGEFEEELAPLRARDFESPGGFVRLS